MNGPRRPVRGDGATASFLKREDGLALTEYLILMGLLTAGTVTAVLAVGGSLNTAWSGWAGWFDDLGAVILVQQAADVTHPVPDPQADTKTPKGQAVRQSGPGKVDKATPRGQASK